jgi:hypothetical protein
VERWEYATTAVTSDFWTSYGTANLMGEQGWELVSVYATQFAGRGFGSPSAGRPERGTAAPTSFTAVFKRRKS